MGLAELSFFFWVYLAVIDQNYRLSKKQIKIFLIPTLLLVSLTISSILAPIPNLAFWGTYERATGLIFLYHCLAFGVVIASLVKARGKEYLQNIYKAVFYSGVIVALATFINENFINIPSLFLFDGPNSADLLGNSSFSAAYLIFCFFLGAVLFFERRNDKNRFWILVGLALILLSPISDKARGAIGGISIGLLLAAAVYLTTNAKKIIRIAGFSVIGIILAGGVAVGAMLMQPTSKIHQAFVEATTNSRFIFWGAAVEGIKDRPVFGWGPENYIVVFGKHFDPGILEPGSTAEVWTDKPHNSVLEYFVIGGFVGGILYLLFALSLFALPVYLYRKKVFGRVTLALFEGMFAAYFLQALILFDMVHNLVIMFGLFGLLTALVPTSSESGRKSVSETIKSLITIVCIVLFAVSWIFFVRQPVKKSKAILDSLDAGANRQAEFAKLIHISPMGNGSEVSFIASTMLIAYHNEIDSITKDPAFTKASHDEIQAFLDTVDSLDEVAENSGKLWLIAAELLNFDMLITHNTSQDDANRVLAYLTRAEELLPNNPRVYWTYGQLYLDTGQYAKAYEAYKKAYDINPNVKRSQQYLKKFEELFGSKIK